MYFCLNIYTILEKTSKIYIAGHRGMVGSAIYRKLKKEGFTKLIASRRYGEILGVLMVGPHVTEMIAEASAFMRLEGTVEELASMIHAHPTVSESVYEAAASWLEKGIHH